VAPSAIRAVATSQARDARNGAAFFDRVKSETGIAFRVISGDEEARLMFEGGLLPGMEADRSAVIDIGGGSTELRTSEYGLSIEMGSVRYSERYFGETLRTGRAVTDAEFWACREAIDAEFRRMRGAERFQGKLLVAVAGTATTLAQIQLGKPGFAADELNQMELTRGDLHRVVEELKWRTVSERREMPGMDPKRADVLLAGALILWRAHEELGFPTCRISTRGLRFGALGLA